MLVPRHHPQLLQPEHTLLLVVDMQEPFLRNLFEADRVTANVCKLIQGMKTLRVPIVASVQNQKAMGEVIPEVKKLLPPMLPAFDKMTFSCLGSSGISSEISRSGRKQIVLCGVESHICISQTALGLLAASYQVHVVADAVSSRSEENWRGGLDRMRQSGALITSIEGALYELLNEAGTSDFKAILEIVK